MSQLPIQVLGAGVERGVVAADVCRALLAKLREQHNTVAMPKVAAAVDSHARQPRSSRDREVT